MRRPLNWIVVCLSLLFLTANLPVDRKRNADWQTLPTLTENKFVEVLSAPESAPLFGYVRADGSFLPLDKREEVPAAANVGTAVYVYSSTISF